MSTPFQPHKRTGIRTVFGQGQVTGEFHCVAHFDVNSEQVKRASNRSGFGRQDPTRDSTPAVLLP